MKGSITKRKRARGRGRPSAQSEADVREALLSAGRSLFLKYGFDRVTARQIAAAAGTTPAMIHYYFDNKIGLFRAMLEQAIGPFKQLLSDAASPAENTSALGVNEPAVDVGTIVAGHMRTAAQNPWIATLVVNEVFAEKGRFRAAFIRDIASRLMPMVIALIEQGKRSGRFRPDLDPSLAALSLLSLCVFPFISRLVTGPVLGVKLEGEPLDQLIAHTAQLYLAGIENKKSESKP